MISLADQCNSIGTFFQATMCSKPRKRTSYKHSWGPRNRGDFKGRIIFMSMSNDFENEEPSNDQKCLENAKEVTQYAKQFQYGHWCFCGHGQERVWYRKSLDTPAGDWDRIARIIAHQFTSGLVKTIRTKKVVIVKCQNFLMPISRIWPTAKA